MPHVLVERNADGVALVTLNRPETLNAMNLELVAELHAVLDVVGSDDDCRAVVITGAGRGFCSGHDLSEMQGGFTVPEGTHVQEAFAGIVQAVHAVPQPVIAAVNGPAAGGGLAIALAADTRVCSESANFNAAFVRLGISGCDVGVSYLLPRVVSPTLAFEMMLSGRLIDAAEAARSGLVLRVVPDGEVVDEAVRVANGILRNSPFAVRMTKKAMWANLDAPSLESAIELENRTQILCTQTRDFHEALSAFVERRDPNYSNQ